MIKHIGHAQDLTDAIHELQRLRKPYTIYTHDEKPTKGTELEKWSRQNSYFHRGIIPTYSKLSGLGEDESKSDLQVRFACVRELKDSHEVESLGGMSNRRLAEFIENCTQFLAMEFGAVVEELLTLNKTKKIKK